MSCALTHITSEKDRNKAHEHGSSFVFAYLRILPVYPQIYRDGGNTKWPTNAITFSIIYVPNPIPFNVKWRIPYSNEANSWALS